MGEDNQFCSGVEDDSTRLDQFLVQRLPNYSRTQIRRAIVEGLATVDDQRAKPAYRLKPNQVIKFELPEVRPSGPIPEDIPLEIIYEDNLLAVINKPPGMVVHPAKGHWSGTLVAALSFHFQSLSQVGGSVRPGILHRLDRDTTGAIVIAKTDVAHRRLAMQWEARTVRKEYLALISPVPDWDATIVNAPICPHPYQREKMAIGMNDPKAKEAETRFEIQQRFKTSALVRAFPKTGRTHQIRVHLAHLGFPILADKLYSNRARIERQDLIPYSQRKKCEPDKPLLVRQALHASAIEFEHPESGVRSRFEAPIPDDLSDAIAFLSESEQAN